MIIEKRGDQVNVIDNVCQMFSRKEIVATMVILFFGLVFCLSMLAYILHSNKKIELKDTSDIILIDGQRYLKLDKE